MAAEDTTEIVHGVESRSPLATSVLAGLRHLMAMFVGIIIAGKLALPLEMKDHLINIALFIFGIGTFLQACMWGPSVWGCCPCSA